MDVTGIGFSIAVTPQTSREFRVGDEIILHTAMIVRDDAFSLYGFQDREDLGLFSLLLSVSGVGPKSALGVLASLTAEQVRVAVAAEDDAPFRRVSGIGPKTAKLIVVQLAGKIAPPSPVTAAATTRAGLEPQVVTALTALGWNEKTAIDAVQAVAAEAGATTVPALLKLALAQLGPARTERTVV